MSDAAHTRAHSSWFLDLKRRLTPKPPPRQQPPSSPSRAAEGPPAESLERWLDGIDPTDQVQCELAARAARLSWELKEGEAALKGLLAQDAERAARERLDEVDRLGQDLLGGSREPPSVLLRRLEASPEGCRWLLDRWLELVALFVHQPPHVPPQFRALAHSAGSEPP